MLDDILSALGPAGAAGAAGKSQTPARVAVNIALAVTPQPTLSFAFLRAPGAAEDSISLQILPNADVVVTSSGDGGMDSGAGGGHTLSNGTQSEREKRLAKALAVCGDVGVWVEWVKQTSV